VGLGVAAVLAVQIVNTNAMAAFRGSVAAISAPADLSITGVTESLPDSLYLRVLDQPGVDMAWPLNRLTVALEGRGRFMELTGVDLFLPTGLPLTDGAGSGPEALTVPGWVAITPELSRRENLLVGDSFAVTNGTRRVHLRVGSLVDLQRVAPGASSALAIMDIAQLQDRFGLGGRVSQIDVRLRPGVQPSEVERRLAEALGPGVVVQTPDDRSTEAASLLQAFRLNLTALSMISVFVGLFLVYGSTRASLVRRRREFGVLRSLGATPNQVMALILVDVAVIGCLGVVVGLPIGYAIAAANLDAVSATVSNLYLLGEIERLTLTPGLYALAALVGLGGALGSALPGALEISRRHPTALLTPFTLQAGLGTAARPMLAAGLVVLVGAGGWYLAFGHGWRPAGFILAAALLIAVSLMTPHLIQLATRSVRVTRVGFRYALRTLAARLPSTAVAVAALSVAVALVVGVTVMVGSFRRTLETWLDSTVRADVYVTTSTWSRSVDASPLDAGLVSTVAAWSEVTGIDRLRGASIHVGGRDIVLAGVAMTVPVANRFALMADAGATVDSLMAAGATIISEPLARRLGLSPGDTLRFAITGGPVALPIAAVYHDYGNEAGAAVVGLGTLERVVGPGPITNIAMYLGAGVDPETTIDRLRTAFPEAPLVLRSNRTLRTEALRIFDQTFAITGVLRTMALLIAVAGITLALIVMARERLGELALYRALGASRRQLFWMFAWKGSAIAICAIALGAVSGIGLALILVHVVNPAFFGWTLRLHWPLASLLGQAVALLAAAFLASVLPALRASNTPATSLSRDDL
jgi:putative ABC transport system permease protein